MFCDIYLERRLWITLLTYFHRRTLCITGSSFVEWTSVAPINVQLTRLILPVPHPLYTVFRKLFRYDFSKKMQVDFTCDVAVIWTAYVCVACCCSCTSKSQCVDADVDNRWLSHDAWECIRVPPQFVNPARIAVTSIVQVRHVQTLSPCYSIMQ